MAAADLFHSFPPHNGRTVVAPPAGWTVVEGQPVSTSFIDYLGEGRTMLSGRWECTPGKFAVEYGAWEFCHMLEGRCTITPEGGEPHHLTPGMAFVLEPGFKGTWEVHEAMSKHFVFKLPAALPG